MNRPASTFDLPGFLRERLALSQQPRNENPPDQEKTPLANGQTPSSNGSNGRDSKGRFTRGNPGGPGNPFSRQLAAFRRAVCAAVKEQDLHDLAAVLLERARGGDLAAIKVLFQYSIGKPADAVDPDRLDLQELDLYLKTAATPDAIAAIFSRFPAEIACNLVRHVLPVLGPEMAASLAHELERDPKERERERELAEEDAELDAWLGLA